MSFYVIGSLNPDQVGMLNDVVEALAEENPDATVERIQDEHSLWNSKLASFLDTVFDKIDEADTVYIVRNKDNSMDDRCGFCLAYCRHIKKHCLIVSQTLPGS